MSVKAIVVLALKLAFLTFLLFGCFSVASLVAGLADPGQPTPTTQIPNPNPKDVMVPLLIMCLFVTIVLSYPIIRSKWTGWRLVIAIFIVYFGISTFLTQIETLVFLDYLVDVVPTDKIPRFFMQGAIVAALFSPLAVLVHGRMRGTNEFQDTRLGSAMPWTEWVLKLISIAVIYLGIYYFFGRFVFIPLAGEAFQEYYGNLQLPMWIYPFQMARGLIWAALALLVIRMMKGSGWESGLAVASLFAVLMGFLLLLPNKWMPDVIRYAHFIEVSSSNFLFGWIVVWLLSRHHDSPSDLFQ